jgi:hypothetical protein
MCGVVQNLARIDTHDINQVDDDYNYRYTGQGVDAYVLDRHVPPPIIAPSASLGN